MSDRSGPISRDLTGRVALVTGANRGIGFETALGLAGAGAAVIVGARNIDAGRAAATAIADRTSATVSSEQLDVAEPESVTRLAERLDSTGTAVDMLVNNAGIYPTTPILSLDETALRGTFDVNFIGPWRLCQAFVPDMRARRWGRVVNVSSALGAICEQTPGAGAYGISKVALNALTKQMAAAAGANVLVNAACPGWVATDMGGPGAPKTAVQGADTVLWLAGLDDDGPTGGFFQDRAPIPW